VEALRLRHLRGTLRNGIFLLLLARYSAACAHAVALYGNGINGVDLVFFLYEELGIIRGAAILVFSIFYIWWLLRTGRIQTQEEIEEILLGMTIIGPIWDRFFRGLTYFEIDTASMFQSALHGSVITVVDKVTQAKGLEPLAEHERKPVMRDFFQRKAYA
jgi:hypothetical protein